jgi:pilus assembly protein CpaD
MQTIRKMLAPGRSIAQVALRAAAVVGAAVLVCACNTDQQITGAPEAPTDYRMRHPITMREADRTFELFIGSSHGALNPTQRAEMLAFAQSWRRDTTGGVIVDLPVGGSNERAAAEAMPEISSILAASGVPPHAIVVHHYRSPPGVLATVRISYPRIAAQAGPCGLWPQDIGPSMNRDYFENQPP